MFTAHSQKRKPREKSRGFFFVIQLSWLCNTSDPMVRYTINVLVHLFIFFTINARQGGCKNPHLMEKNVRKAMALLCAVALSIGAGKMPVYLLCALVLPFLYISGAIGMLKRPEFLTQKTWISFTPRTVSWMAAAALIMTLVRAALPEWGWLILNDGTVTSVNTLDRIGREFLQDETGDAFVLGKVFGWVLVIAIEVGYQMLAATGVMVAVFLYNITLSIRGRELV